MWRDETDAYLTFMRASGASASTLRLRRWQLEHVADRCPRGPWATTMDDLVAVVASPDWKPETRKSVRSAVRGFYRWAVLTGRTERDPAAHLPSVRIPRAMPRPTPVVVAKNAINSADDRTALMLALGTFCGLRRAEISAVHTDDLADDLVGRSLRIVGKGGRVRLVPLPDDLAARLDAMPRGFIFPGQIDGHLSPGHVGKLVARALSLGWTAHTLRHRFASTAYAETKDLRAVQELLGHASVATTERYTAVPQTAMRQAVEAVRGAFAA